MTPKRRYTASHVVGRTADVLSSHTTYTSFLLRSKT